MEKSESEEKRYRVTDREHQMDRITSNCLACAAGASCCWQPGRSTILKKIGVHVIFDKKSLSIARQVGRETCQRYCVSRTLLGAHSHGREWQRACVYHPSHPLHYLHPKLIYGMSKVATRPNAGERRIKGDVFLRGIFHSKLIPD